MACTQFTTAVNCALVPELLEFTLPDDESMSSVADPRAYNMLSQRDQDEVDLMLTLADDAVPCWNCMKNVATFTRAAFPFCSDGCADEYLYEMSLGYDAELAEAA